MSRPATDKRQRLVTAAIDQFHQVGYSRSSLADVAKAAGISAGNVFYYFKTKDDLARAAVDEWCSLLAGYLSALESERDPWQRVEGFIEQARTMSDIYVSMGCPLAGLTRDLKQENDGLKGEASRIYAVQFAWLAEQFRLAGVPCADCEEHSRYLMAAYHGSILLAFAQSDPSLINGEVKRLKNWIREIQKSDEST